MKTRVWKWLLLVVQPTAYRRWWTRQQRARTARILCTIASIPLLLLVMACATSGPILIDTVPRGEPKGFVQFECIIKSGESFYLPRFDTPQFSVSRNTGEVLCSVSHFCRVAEMPGSHNYVLISGGGQTLSVNEEVRQGMVTVVLLRIEDDVTEGRLYDLVKGRSYEITSTSPRPIFDGSYISYVYDRNRTWTEDDRNEFMAIQHFLNESSPPKR